MLNSSSIYWQLRATVRRNGCSGGDCYEIPLVDLGKTFASSYCAVSVSTSGYKPTWDYGGDLWASFPLFNKDALVSKRELRVNSYHVIYIPLLLDDKYRLHYKAPKWFPDFTIKVWEYRGEILPDESVLELRLDDIEGKLDLLLDAVGNGNGNDNGDGNSITPVGQPATLENFFLFI